MADDAIPIRPALESGAPELTWALLMALARKIVAENKNMRSGNWQTTVGVDLKGKTLGIVGLGRIGSKIAAYAKAFEMSVIAWSENLTAERVAEAGAVLVSKESLFQWSDFVTVHLVLSDRSRGIIGAKELEEMKPSAFDQYFARAAGGMKRHYCRCLKWHELRARHWMCMIQSLCRRIMILGNLIMCWLRHISVM